VKHVACGYFEKGSRCVGRMYIFYDLKFYNSTNLILENKTQIGEKQRESY
jgi:hypothetical protein